MFKIVLELLLNTKEKEGELRKNHSLEDGKRTNFC